MVTERSGFRLDFSAGCVLVEDVRIEFGNGFQVDLSVPATSALYVIIAFFCSTGHHLASVTEIGLISFGVLSRARDEITT